MIPENQSRPEFDTFADRYEELLSDPLRDQFAKSPQYFHWRKLEVLRLHFASTGRSLRTLRWLDLGCGKGDLLKMGKEEFATACGCDVSPESLKHCAGLNVRVQPSTDTIPFESGSFDLVTAACVYHHVDLNERASLTASARTALAPGGTFCIFEHNPRNPVTRAIVSRSPVDVNAVLLPSRESISLLRNAGFTSTSVRYFLFAPEGLGKRLGRIEKWLGGIPFGGQYAAFGELPKS